MVAFVVLRRNKDPVLGQVVDGLLHQSGQQIHDVTGSKESISISNKLFEL